MIGTTASHYRIISQIGAGGMGTVYLAEDTHLQRRVALKFLAPDTASHPDAAARLLREGRAASALDHPHIATVYEIGDHAGQPFIAMAYYEGETLAVCVARGPLPLADIARVIAQVADALDAAHAAGIVHRDLKPSNVMLTAKGQVKILDFGLAKIDMGETATQLTRAGTTLGTAGYMSPEQAAGHVADARSDLWSLGIVAYEMLGGRAPFHGTNTLAIIQAVLTAAIVPIRTLRPDVAPELEEIVSRTLVRDRDRRTIAAADVRDLASACHARLASSGQQPAIVRPKLSRRTQIAAAVVALALVGSGVAWWTQRNAKIRWARQVALPEIVRLAEAEKFDAAYRLALQARPYIPDDPLLARQIEDVSTRADVQSEPAGAQVFYRPYGRDEPWRQLGTTPVVNATIPDILMQWKVEMAGHETAEDLGPAWEVNAEFHFKLFAANQVPTGMVRIRSAGQPFKAVLPGLEQLPEVTLPDYWIDRHEVTNREFKRFIDEGGYRRPELWREAFLKDGRKLTFEAAITQFRDATGRPGPATWETGTYVPGLEEYPVAGVSWYEAAAYARWAGKSLPTIYHWSRAADQRLSADVVPLSNFGGRSLRAVGEGGITRGGTTDMAGNVKEWCLNASGANSYILGGAWSEPVYMFNDPDALSPFARQPTHGFRCIKVDRPEDLSASLTGAIEASSRDPRKAKPVSEPVFQTWRTLLYSFDHGHLNTKVESMDDSSREWRIERVSYAAAYGRERIPAYLVVPRNASPPYHVVVVFPGANAMYERSSATTRDVEPYLFVVRSGRALLYPIYKGTFERGDDVVKDPTPNMTTAYRDYMIMWAKDLGRSVDYLESRPDIAKSKIGLLGLSWGAELAPLLLAVEPRLSLGLICLGAINLQPSLPEADPVNFAPRVKVPVLILNGRYDFLAPTAVSQEPLYRILGTAPQHKRRIVYESSHAIPRNEMIRETVDWMEKYWGPAVR
jgi:dienelactone hydrolase